MPLTNACRFAHSDAAVVACAHTFALLLLIASLMFAGAVKADPLDATRARFLDDKFPQTEKAIGELAAQAPPQAAAILDALGDNRLLFDAADHLVAYKTATGALVNARTGEPISDATASPFKNARLNNALPPTTNRAT